MTASSINSTIPTGLGRRSGSEPDGPTAPRNALEVRERLEDALRLDLVGPTPRHSLEREELPGWNRPSNWYLTGFLVPHTAIGDARSDDDAEEDAPNEVPDRLGVAEESVEDLKAAKRSFFPSSMGLSFLVGSGADDLAVTVSWGEYEKAEARDGKGKPIPVWRRRPREESVSIRLKSCDGAEVKIPDSGGLCLHGRVRELSGDALGDQIASGTRAVSLFLVNERQAPGSDQAGSNDIYQARIGVRCESGFVGRPHPRGAPRGSVEAAVADLQYAGVKEYATGHNVAADWDIGADGVCRQVHTTWIPRAEVEAVQTGGSSGAMLSMTALGGATDGATTERMLLPLVIEYRSWIGQQRAEANDFDASERKVAEELLRQAEVAADRMERGVAVLKAKRDVLDAFRVANRAVGTALTRRTGTADPEWRPFQIAFLLLNLSGLADPTSPEREIADLLFFPTGGGKTEAYLGLAAFAMVLRRLRNRENGGRVGAGVSVIMRYTLRLLTFDQLGRAAALICALELERERRPERYGEWPFEIGLWVGKAATPNHMGRKGYSRPDTAKSWLANYQGHAGNKSRPIPLTNCPWCGKKLGPASFWLEPNTEHPTNLKLGCPDPDCDFSGGRALPIVAVDEPLYRRLPAFLIATVDKFAALPWVGPSGALLGGADRWDRDGFYGAAEPRRGNPLARPLLPPDLIIQDELHLISGPLGTMTGLYEAAIDALASQMRGGQRVRPKIVASTATVNRAAGQVQAIFGRAQTQTFPPPGPARRDSFFAIAQRSSEVPGQLFLGVAAPGRSPKVVMRRILVALAGAAQREFENAKTTNGDNPADPYMTMLGYFNALRELGGARRIIEEEVQHTLRTYGSRKRVGESRGLFSDRKGATEVVELTSRVSTGKVADARRRLGARFGQEGAVAWAIATNMISVGLDIQRLGLMVVMGQPKTHSEYIQATSRVGRDSRRPGLIVTLLNVHKPRDRSHYERFRHYHESFYRSVEAGSVTPFAVRALDRGFAGALVALARHSQRGLTPSLGAGTIGVHRVALEEQLLDAFTERIQDQSLRDLAESDARRQSLRARTLRLLDSWESIQARLEGEGVRLKYQKHEDGKGQPLLREMLDQTLGEGARFRTGRSLRDVEPAVNLLRSGEPDQKGKADTRLGSIRQSQAITTFGVGSLIDLPTRSAIVGGLDDWKRGAAGEWAEIDERRLAERLRIFTNGQPPRLISPPAAPENNRQDKRGVPVHLFPRWFVERNPKSTSARTARPRSRVTRFRRLIPASDLDDNRLMFEGQRVVATRFVRACPKGHVDDLDWCGFVHRGGKACHGGLTLQESGTTGDLSETYVRCGCGKIRNLGEARESVGACSGKRPWFGGSAKETCNEKARLLIRTASNAWFPQIVSVLSLPDLGSQLDRAIALHWHSHLRYVDDDATLDAYMRNPNIKAALDGFERTEVLDAIAARRDGVDVPADRPLKAVELDALVATKERMAEEPPEDSRFHACRLSEDIWKQAHGMTSQRVAAVVQVHRLREVMALTGFTRLEAVMRGIDGEYGSEVQRAALFLDEDWFPAIENRGEGFFIQLESSAVRQWSKRRVVEERVRRLEEGQERWNKQGKKLGTFPGGSYVLLHTLSHLLIQSVAMRCGYPAASIRERVYVDDAGERYGLLLFTASTGSEGTLGGLVEQASRIEEHLAAALDTAALCSSDPVCALHEPGKSMEERWLHGAACHGCALVAETSCEMHNDYLDRALVAPVIGTEDAAFFGRPGGP